MANFPMLSSDVSAGYDLAFTRVALKSKNSAIMGHGLAFNKFFGSGKFGSNDAVAST